MTLDFQGCFVQRQPWSLQQCPLKAITGGGIYITVNMSFYLLISNDWVSLNYRIDCDPDIFAVILNWLRHGQVKGTKYEVMFMLTEGNE